MKQKRELHMLVLMVDGTLIHEVKQTAWSMDQWQAYWDRKAHSEKTSVRISTFGYGGLNEGWANEIYQKARGC